MVQAPSSPQGERLLVGVAATLSVTFTDYTGEPVDAAGSVTVDINHGDGSSLVAGGTTSHAGTGVYQYSLVAASNQQLDWLAATWKDSGVQRAKTTHEIVGGFYFSASYAGAFDTAIDIGDLAKVHRARAGVERECERITGISFVPRYRRLALDGTGTERLLLPNLYPRTVRSVDIYADAVNFTSFTSSQLAAIECKDAGYLVLRDGTNWTLSYTTGLASPGVSAPFYGGQNVVLEYEHGWDSPPEELRDACVERLRYRLNIPTSPAGLEDAVQWGEPGGRTFQLSDPNTDDIGQREVWRTYLRYREKPAGIA